MDLRRSGPGQEPPADRDAGKDADTVEPPGKLLERLPARRHVGITNDSKRVARRLAVYPYLDRAERAEETAQRPFLALTACISWPNPGSYKGSYVRFRVRRWHPEAADRSPRMSVAIVPPRIASNTGSRSSTTPAFPRIPPANVSRGSTATGSTCSKPGAGFAAEYWPQRDVDRAGASPSEGPTPDLSQEGGLRRPRRAPVARRPWCIRPATRLSGFVAKVGPTAIDRLNAYLWPDGPPAASGRRHAKAD